MRFSITSVISIIFFSGISLGLIRFVVKRNQLIMNMGIRFLSICLFLVSLRLFFPVELPVSRNLLIHSVLPEICLLLLRPVPFLNITFQSLLGLIWVSGALIAIFRLIFSYRRLKRDIYGIDCITDENIDAILSDITKSYKKKVHFGIVKTNKTSTPMCFGIFKPRIVIPDMELSNQELFYIFSHEVAHYYHKDLFYKFSCEILHALHWWNPLIILLKKQITSLMEINIDKSVTSKMDKIQTLEYLQCLIKIARIREKGSKRNPCLVTFYSENTLTASRRFDLVLNEKRTTNVSSAISLVMMLLLLFSAVLLPNFFIIEPHGVPDKIEKETVTIDEENAYFILNPDNTYDLYLNHEYKVTVESIFNENIPIYQSTQEAREND